METLRGQTRPGEVAEPKRCECGCGGLTPIAKRTRPQFGHVKGQPTRFIKGHHASRAMGPKWLVKDCGHETPCRLWQRHINRDGYGSTKLDGRSVTTHVMAWVAVNGPVPAGLELDHLCRQRSCGEPTHLEPVPQIVNLRRGLVAKLTVEAVLTIRTSSLSSADLAERFGVKTSTITSVRRGDRWADVGGPIKRRPKGKPRGRYANSSQQRDEAAS